MSFALCQTMAALWAGSEAMLGDSAAMMVDALTYLFNLLAERQKHYYVQIQHQEDMVCPSKYPLRAKLLRRLKYKQYTLQLELIPPLVSVTTLLIVTGFVLHTAIRVIILDSTRDPSLQADPNVHIMMMFSFCNLCLDGFNVFCFAKAKHALGYKTTEDDENDHDGPEVYGTNDSLEATAEAEAINVLDETKNRNHHTYDVEKQQQHQQEQQKQLRHSSPSSTSSSPSSSQRRVNNKTRRHPPTISVKRPLIQHDVLQHQHDHERNGTMIENPTTGVVMEPFEIEELSPVTHADLEDDHHANLNMCSAYTVRSRSLLLHSSLNWRISRKLTRDWFLDLLPFKKQKLGLACLCRYVTKYCCDRCGNHC